MPTDVPQSVLDLIYEHASTEFAQNSNVEKP
jgi:hypothetical protein